MDITRPNWLISKVQDLSYDAGDKYIYSCHVKRPKITLVPSCYSCFYFFISKIRNVCEMIFFSNIQMLFGNQKLSPVQAKRISGDGTFMNGLTNGQMLMPLRIDLFAWRIFSVAMITSDSSHEFTKKA